MKNLDYIVLKMIKLISPCPHFDDRFHTYSAQASDDWTAANIAGKKVVIEIK